MKKLFLSIILLSITQFAQAQTNKFELGVEVGPSVAVSNAGAIALPVYFATGGFTIQYNVSQYFSIKSGIGYEKKGYSTSEPFTDSMGRPTSGTINGSEQLQYAIIPIMAKVSLGKDIKFIAELGPYFGYLINETEYLSAIDPTGKSFNGKNDETVHYNRLDVGISAGIGIQIPLSDKLLLEVEVRNNLGLSNTYAVSVFGNQGPTNESFDLLVSLRWTKLFE